VQFRSCCISLHCSYTLSNKLIYFTTNLTANWKVHMSATIHILESFCFSIAVVQFRSPYSPVSSIKNAIC